MEERLDRGSEALLAQAMRQDPVVLPGATVWSLHELVVCVDRFAPSCRGST